MSYSKSELSQKFIEQLRHVYVLENAPTVDYDFLGKEKDKLRVLQRELNERNINPWEVDGELIPVKKHYNAHNIVELKGKTFKIGNDWCRMFSYVAWASNPVRIIARTMECGIDISDINKAIDDGEFWIVEEA